MVDPDRWRPTYLQLQWTNMLQNPTVRINSSQPLATICYITSGPKWHIADNSNNVNIANTEIRVNPRIGWASARLFKGNILLHSLDPWFCTTSRARKALQISLNSLVCKPFFSLRWLGLIINPCGNVKIIVDIPKGTKF